MDDGRDENQGVCSLSHNLINQLTVIVICCDLLKDEPADPAENARRLFLIRRAAKSVARELGRHQCDYEMFPGVAEQVKSHLAS